MREKNSQTAEGAVSRPAEPRARTAISRSHEFDFSRLDKARILVVGDVMLDRYWFGEVSRISPEAPVPVVKVGRTEERLGGAANVARNIAALGAQVSLLSVIGDDEAGTKLSRMLDSESIAGTLRKSRDISTTIKLRIIGRQQQLLRADFETPPSHEVLAESLSDYENLLPQYGVVILSDYGKGGLAHIERMIAVAREVNKPVLVDPKGDDYTRYRGATIITPNRAEFREIAGSWKNDDELEMKAQQLREQLNLQALLLTRSDEGMTLYRKSGALHVAAMAREVFDVSGAGDTVIATLGVMLAAGAGLQTAVEYANRAAGIVVGKLGTAVVTRGELS